MDLMSNDANKDGKVSLDEAPERLKEHFSAIDTNSDGFIDSKEAGELRRKMQEMAKQQGGGAGGPGGP